MGYVIGFVIGFALSYHAKVRAFTAKALVVSLALFGLVVLVVGALA